MTIMTFSPMQHEYVTKKEFNGLKSYMNEGFEMTNEHIENLEKHIDIKLGDLKKDIYDLTKTVNKIAVKIL